MLSIKSRSQVKTNCFSPKLKKAEKTGAKSNNGSCKNRSRLISTIKKTL